MNLWQTILVFGALVVVFDGIWATIAHHSNYSYAKGMWVSWLIYTVAGGIACWHSSSILVGTWAGLGVAAIEATIGWQVSAVIGPGRLPESITSKEAPKAIATAILTVILTGAGLGTVGAVLSTLLMRLL
jgi:hypothetical protein